MSAMGKNVAIAKRAVDRAVASRMGRPTREAAGLIAKRVLDAALSLACERGYDGIVMNDVAERAGVSKKTLYSRFEDKDDLVANMIHHALDRHVWASGRDHGDGPVRDRILNTLKSLLLSTLKPEIMAIERLVQVRPDYERHPSILATRSVPVQILRDLLVEAQETGIVKMHDPTVVAFLLLDAMVLGPRTRHMKRDAAERGDHRIDAEAAVVFDLVWAGLTPAAD